MGSVILGTMGKMLVAMGLKMVTAEAMEEIVLWILGKLVAHTESKADDELLALVKKHLQK